MENIEDKILQVLAEKEKLKHLSKEDLVIECLKSEASDYLIVNELMDRVWPNWAQDLEDDET